jgi:Domain of unknown function (DUF4124)
MLRTLLFIIGVAFTGTAAAQYKWVDQNGKVQYGDAPPPGVNAAPMHRRGPPVTYSQPEASDKKDGDPKDNAKKGPLTTAEQDAEFRKRQKQAEQDRQKQAKAEQDAADKRENCARAQENTRVLEGGRVARTDSKGETYYLDDAQLKQESVRAHQLVREWCN